MTAPLQITNPATQVAVLNRWAEDVATEVTRLTTLSNRHSESIKKVQIQQASGGGATKASLNVPSIFTPTTQTVTLPGPLSFGLAPESPATVFQAPPPGLSGFEGFSSGTATGGRSTSVTATPTTSSSLGLYIVGGSVAPVAPSGWTSIGSTGRVFINSISGTAPVSITQSSSVGTDLIHALGLFVGPAPPLVQSNSKTAGALGTLAFPGANTAGNTLVIVMQSWITAGAVSHIVSDSNNNHYQQVLLQNYNGVNSNQQTVFIAPNCVGGANTVSYNFSGLPPNSDLITIMELGPLPNGSNTPIFANLPSGAIPPINLQAEGNGGVGGTLPVLHGGLGIGTLTPAHGVLIAEGTAHVAVTGAGTAGQVLTSNGASADPTFQGIVLQTTTTILSTAQILALQGTPVILVAAPGLGFTILPLAFTIIFFGGSAAYTDAGGAVSFSLGSATQALASNAIFTTATSPNKQIQRIDGLVATDIAGNPPNDDNAALTISKATNNFAAGNGTAKVIVHYVIVSTT